MNFSSFDKFQEEIENKFDSAKNQHQLSYDTITISNIIDNSIPIWDVLNITEQEYNLKYNSNSKIIENINIDSNSISNSFDISLNETVNKDI